jgi:hypothetical protein
MTKRIACPQESVIRTSRFVIRLTNKGFERTFDVESLGLPLSVISLWCGGFLVDDDVILSRPEGPYRRTGPQRSAECDGLLLPILDLRASAESGAYSYIWDG